jgi:trans-aconitate methyltransferase
MNIDDPATAYGLFTGRFSEHLTRKLAAFVDPTLGQHVIDVGCGPGAPTQVLVAKLGAAGVSAVDPSEAFVVAHGSGCPASTYASRRPRLCRTPRPPSTPPWRNWWCTSWRIRWRD